MRKIGFYGKIEEIGNIDIRYRFAGISNENGTFTGGGDGYVGGGCTQDFFVYQNIIIPNETSAGYCLENEEMEDIMILLTDKNFIKEISDKMYEYSRYKGEGRYISINDIMTKEGYLVVGDIKPISWSMTSWEEPFGIPIEQSEKFSNLEDFLDHFEIDYSMCEEDEDLNVSSIGK